MLQALGSKAEGRAKRRKKKKDSYAKYLDSPEWKKIRRRALRRDNHTCRACGAKAEHVHHIRYPKNLGEEKMDWLYSLCAPCHNEIHRLAQKMILRKATRHVLGLPQPPPKRKAKKPKKVRSAHITHNKSKKQRLIDENERLRETFRQNREKRERRWDLAS